MQPRVNWCSMGLKGVLRMKWLKQNVWIFGILLAVVLPFAVFFSFFGNPVSLVLAQEGAEAYVQAHAPGWEVTNVGYDFITPKYYAHVGDGNDRFTLHMDGWGNVYFNTQEK